MPQSFHYVNKELELSDAQEWMEEVRQLVGESEARQRMVLTWRQSDIFLAGQSLYPLLDNR